MSATWLVVRGGALGDFILTIPVIEALAARVGPVDLVANPRYAALRPDLVARITDINGLGALWLHGAGAAPASYTHALVFTPGVASRLRQLGATVLQGPARPPPGVHATRAMAEALAPLGPSPLRPPTIGPGRHPDASTGPVVLAPGAAATEKVWPYFDALLHVLSDRGVEVVVAPGHAEPLPAGLAGAAGPPLDLAGLVALARGCAAWIGNDTGTTHLAAAAGAPTFALFGPTDPRCWAPEGAVVLSMRATPHEVADAVLGQRAGGP